MVSTTNKSTTVLSPDIERSFMYSFSAASGPVVVGGEGSGNREEHSESLKEHVQVSWGRWIWSMQSKMSLR